MRHRSVFAWVFICESSWCRREVSIACCLSKDHVVSIDTQWDAVNLHLIWHVVDVLLWVTTNRSFHRAKLLLCWLVIVSHYGGWIKLWSLLDLAPRWEIGVSSTWATSKLLIVWALCLLVFLHINAIICIDILKVHLVFLLNELKLPLLLPLFLLLLLLLNILDDGLLLDFLKLSGSILFLLFLWSMKSFVFGLQLL